MLSNFCPMLCDFCFISYNNMSIFAEIFEVMANDKPTDDRTYPKDIIPPRERVPFEGEKIPSKKS